jgi:hypothetical protein
LGPKSGRRSLVLVCVVLVCVSLAKQLRRPRDVDRDPPRLVRGEYLRLLRVVGVVAAVEISQRLPIGMPDDKPPAILLARQGGWKRRDPSATPEGSRSISENGDLCLVKEAVDVALQFPKTDKVIPQSREVSLASDKT